jgi:transcriptional regulator with XRE-family HTH domain
VDWARLVRQWRNDSGLSLEAAGRLLGVAHTSIRDWERGRRPLDLHRHALCELLDIVDPEQPPSPLRLRRAAQGLSMGQLADKIHVSRATLSNWERRRRRPATTCIPHLAHALDLSEQQVAKLFRGYPETGATRRVPLPALREIRLSSGTSQRALAARIGVSVPTLYECESGSAIVPAARLPNVATALGVSVEALTAATVVHPRTAANLAPLSRLRRRRGLTQRQVAARLGFSVKQLAALEAGRRVLTLPICHALARIYRCPFRQVAPHRSAVATGKPGWAVTGFVTHDAPLTTRFKL